ncbi:hypothetical protein FJY63_06870 [Candidatus Sumerlaeota bacterium]|nr:hypothetical protein [Candidatus Sumerlaeota bacterium]
MERPDAIPGELLEQMERRLGISREEDDVRFEDLGSPACQSFYSNREPAEDLVRMRKKFDKVSRRYGG